MATLHASVDPIIAEARERWNQCNEKEDKQRTSTLLAKQFRAGDQWPAGIKLAREGSTATQGVAAQPPRPCLTVDRLSPAIRQISNQIKGAHFAITVLPNGFGADTDLAKIYQGYIRRVQVNSRAESPVEWAADQAIEGGFGYFRLRTDYVAQDDKGADTDPIGLFDQELLMERIPNNLSVYCDPHANKPTRSDALFYFVTEDLSKDEFKRRWPKADVRSLEDFAATGDMKSWVDEHTVRIAEYWRIKFEDIKVALLQDGSLSWGKDIPDDTDQIKAKRTIRKPVVECYTINAVEVLEKYEWTGSKIPLIPILGEELNVDGQVVLRGVTQEGMDAQRMVNYAYSGAIEIFSLGSKSPYIVEEQQLANYKDIWQTANTFNYSYLPYQHVNGVEAPHRDQSEAPIQAAVELMVKSEDAIKATTSIYDPALGKSTSSVQSARLQQSLQAQSDLGASNYPSNVQRALIYAGELMVEVIPRITRPGQVLQILGDDEQPDQAMLGQHYIPHEGQPVPTTPQGQPVNPQGQPAPPPQGFPQDPGIIQSLVKFYDPSKGRYAVTVDVGKGSATKREEGSAALGDLIPHLPPPMAAALTPEYIENLSFDGAHKAAEIARKALPPELQQQEDGQQQIPPQIQAQLQAMGQKLQQAEQFIQTKQAEQQGQIEQAKIKASADLQTTQMEIQSRERIAMIQASAQLSAVGAKVDAENARSFVDALENRFAGQLEAHMKHLTQMHEAIQATHDRAHEVGMAAVDHQKALEQGQQAHAQSLEQGAQSNANALEQGQQAADLAPEPAQGGNDAG